ncbi:MAG: DUF2905 domain-containing protein [Halothiobacillaceae bacterium]
MSRWLIVAGAVLIVLGLIWHYAPWLLNWFGRLPGDIRIENGNTRIYIPIVSMLIVSIVISVVLGLFFRR